MNMLLRPYLIFTALTGCMYNATVDEASAVNTDLKQLQFQRNQLDGKNVLISGFLLGSKENYLIGFTKEIDGGDCVDIDGTRLLKVEKPAGVSNKKFEKLLDKKIILFGTFINQDYLNQYVIGHATNCDGLLIKTKLVSNFSQFR